MSDYFNNFFYRPYRNTQFKVSFKDYKLNTGDDAYSILFKGFKEKIRKNIVNELIKNKDMSEDKATIFTDNLLSPNYKKHIDINKEIEKYYNDGLSSLESAKNLIDKYYKITVINNDNELDVKDDVILESLKIVSNSLFYNFINRLKNLKLKFILNNQYIKGINNSLNHDNYDIYFETNSINSTDVKREFKYSKILSTVVTSIDLYTDNNIQIKFYIGIDHYSYLNFGYIINNKRINIGKFKYKTIDIKKISDIIISNDTDINIDILSNKFLSTLKLINHYKKVFINVLHLYDDIDVYISINNNKFCVIIESSNNDVINKKYLYNIINDNIFKKMPFKYKWSINTNIYNKVYYYFTID
ncbi:hypothetical protein [Trichloromonas sp.]|uniref:hypothetical protein n=1 Tax=Trichloromonas sp. TaxID=3069249 RepID=UPI002A484D9E|nr:hypothetical protein [Trichloromonas sp.]